MLLALYEQLSTTKNTEQLNHLNVKEDRSEGMFYRLLVDSELDSLYHQLAAVLSGSIT